jgi:hypothetical protein
VSLALKWARLMPEESKQLVDVALKVIKNKHLKKHKAGK